MSTEDPRKIHPAPPFPKQQQEHTGRDSEMKPKADHGEQSYRGFDRLKGKAALITGADSGIGRAVALAYAREGADVLISYLDQDEDAKETSKLVTEAGRRAILARGDVGSPRHCADLVEQCVDQLGGIDILVNNAAFQATHERLEDFTADEIEHTFRTNIFSMFFLSQAALPRMRKGGAIINTASIQAYKPTPQLLAYATTKGAIVTFTKALAGLAIEHGIRVNSVAPGPVWTPLIPATMPAKKVEKFGEQTPMGRPAQPAELAPAYVFLATSDSTYITGEILGVGGGMFFG